MRGQMAITIKFVSVFTYFLMTAGSTHAQGKVFSLPDSCLLFGGSTIVTPDASEEIPVPPNIVNKGPRGFPSLSADGNLLSSGFPVELDSSKIWGARCAV